MKKKSKNQLIWAVIALIAISVFFYGGQQGWFKSISNTAFNSNSYSSSLNPSTVNDYATYTAGLYFTPNTICLGSSSTGSIDTNIPNGECTIFYNDGSWKPWKAVTLDANGDYQETQTPNADYLGTNVARAVCCDAQGNCKVTNQATLTVNNCNVPPSEKTCEQKAAENNLPFFIEPMPGASCLQHAQIDCQQKGQVISGWAVVYDCCMYKCEAQQQEPICTDTDGGQDDQYYVKGIVSSSVTNTAMMDECDWGTGQLKEYYCREDNTIGVYYHGCTDYWTCQEGKCAQQLCEDIMNPTMEKCASGYTTDGGICQFWNINNNPQCISSFNNGD